MNTTEIKKLLKASTAILMLEDGEPSYVILDYEAYKDFILKNENEKKGNIKINSSSSGDAVFQDRNTRAEVVVSDSLNQPDADVNRFQDRLTEKEADLLDKINKQILALKNEIEKEEKGLVD
jgi:hypothetical protein